MLFDIGSNVGEWTSQNLNSTDKIISIEASPATFNKLKNRFIGNSKVECLNYAVCNNNLEDTTFYECPCDVLSTLNKNWFDDEKSRFYSSKYTPITVKTITIDKLIELYGIPDLIKIDVESGEFDCVTSLTQKVQNLCFEWASETNDITFNCLDYLSSLGFSKFYLQIGDAYTFRPSSFVSLDEVKEQLNKTTPKVEWGMIWCS